MAHSAPYTVSAPSPTVLLERAASIPWYVWSSAIAVTATTVGLYWDISWHMSIGRDTFWTPAHLCIHFGAIVAGLSAIYLILSTTFGKNRATREIAESTDATGATWSVTEDRVESQGTCVESRCDAVV